MKRLPLRQGRTLTLALAVLAALAIALWLGIFSQERAAASPADLTVVVTSTPASGTTLAQGSRISYVVTVATDANPGAIVPLNIVLSGASAVVATVTASGGITCPTIAAGSISCNVPATFTGGSVTFDATVTAAAPGPVLVGAALDPATAGNFGVLDEGAAGDTPEDGGDDALACDTVGETTLPNTGPAGPTPPAEPDNFACTSHAVGTANLTIAKTASPAEGTTVLLGSTITYTLTAINAAGTTGTATNVLIRDILSTGLTYASAVGSAGVTCTHPSAQQIDCTAATITAPGGTATVTITATVAASSGALLNGAYIDPLNAITETNEDNNDLDLVCGAVGEGGGNAPEDEPDNFDCTTHTAGAVDLTITKTASPVEGAGAKTGDPITYTLTVSNSTGTGATVAATNVPIRDILGTGLTYVSATGTGVTCTHTSAQQIDCTVASIAAGASATVTVAATVSATSGTVLNGARVDPANVIPETNEDADDPDLTCAAVGEGTTTATEPDNFDCTSHTVGAAAGALLNCPLSGRWALSVWNGPSGKPIAEALATCTSVNIVAAYSLDRTTNTWLKYFPGRGTDINDLLSLSSMQAIITRGQ